MSCSFRPLFSDRHLGATVSKALPHAVVVVTALLTALSAQAQSGPPSGVGGGQAGGAARPPAAASAAPSGARPSTKPSSAAPTSAPGALFGLRPAASPRTLTLEDALARTSDENFDLRVLREKITQSEINVRKAWALMLPNITASGNYTFNCQFLSKQSDDTRKLLNCADQTLTFVDEQQLQDQSDSLQAQALLFRTVGGMAGDAADFTTDLNRQAELRAQAQGLLTAADGLDQASQDVLDTKIEPIVIQPAHVVNGTLSVTMPLFNGRSIPLLQNAYTAVDLTKVTAASSRSALMFSVARAYYGAVTAKKFVKIAQEQLKSAERHRDATKERVELNTLTPLALRRAELDVVRARMGLRSAQNSYRLAVGNVGQLIGEDTEFDVTDPGPPTPAEQSASAEELIAQALSGRGDIKAQKLALLMADRSRLDAWMMFMPSVNLIASARTSSNQSGFVASAGSSALMIQASIPLYDGGQRYAALRESSSKIREELIKVRQLEKKVEGQIRGGLADIQMKKDALDLAQDAVELARASQEQAQALFEQGVATSLDVSDANLGVFLAELDLARAELNLDQSRLTLLYGLGSFPSGEITLPRELSDEEAKAARELADEVTIP